MCNAFEILAHKVIEVTLADNQCKLQPDVYKRYMARQKSNLKSTAFQQPFYTPEVGANTYVIPDEYENILLDIYTSHTCDSDDIHISQLQEILRSDLQLPIELIPTENELSSWAIENTDILDFEKWLYNGYFWLLLSRHISEVDMIWNDVWAALGKEDTIVSLRLKVLSLSDIRHLISIGKLDVNAEDMLHTAANGNSYITFVDFFRLLGRLGAFK